MSREYYVDVQFLQTGAFSRGMGRYFQALFAELINNDKKSRFHCLYTAHLPADSIDKFKDYLEDKKLIERVSFEALDLRINQLDKHVYDYATEHNQVVIDALIDSGKQSSDKVVWLQPCLMQEPIVPIMPTVAGVTKTIIWYDLIPYLLYEHYFRDKTSPHARSYLKRLNLLLRADHIFTISESSKADLVEHISLPGRRLTNINGSANEEVVNAKELKDKPYAKGPFFLCPASPEPSKNMLNTIKGFGEFNAKNDNKYHLVITSDYDASLAKNASKYAKNVTFTGHVSANDLKSLYKNCEGLLFASKYEGLGLPIIEAVHFNKKVVCSSIPVFQEICSQAFYWCDPYSPASIAQALSKSIATKHLTPKQKEQYGAVLDKYSWSNTTKAYLNGVKSATSLPEVQKALAVVGPHPSSFSTIGKVIGETFPYMLEGANVDYYYDSGPSDARHGLVHFHYLQEYKSLYPIDSLPESIDKYDKVIYHMGSSDHHMKTYILSKLFPATMVLHDTSLGGKGLAGQMLSNGFVSKDRLKLETDLETKFLNKPERFITSLVSSQLKMIAHSDFAASVIDDYHLGDKKHTIKTNLPIHTFDLPSRPADNGPLRLGITGILSEVKGTDMLEWLFAETNNLEGCELYIFGFGFFVNKTRLLELAMQHPNLIVAFDLSNSEFKNLLHKLDLLVNYRFDYHGETSRTTLEAMREKVVPIVRDIGWFSELPDSTCFKLDGIERLPMLVNKFRQNPSTARQELQPMVEAGQALLKESYNFEKYVHDLIED